MSEDVEPDIGHHHPGHHPLQVSDQLDTKEDGEDSNDLGTVAHQPVAPVEDPPERRHRAGATPGNQRLDDSEGQGGQTQDRVGVSHDEHEAVGPAAEIIEDD